MKITTVTYKGGYKLSHDFNSVSGEIAATALVEEGETPDEAEKALRKQVRRWLRADYAEARKILRLDTAEQE